MPKGPKGLEENPIEIEVDLGSYGELDAAQPEEFSDEAPLPLKGADVPNPKELEAAFQKIIDPFDARFHMMHREDGTLEELDAADQHGSAIDPSAHFTIEQWRQLMLKNPERAQMLAGNSTFHDALYEPLMAKVRGRSKPTTALHPVTYVPLGKDNAPITLGELKRTKAPGGNHNLPPEIFAILPEEKLGPEDIVESSEVPDAATTLEAPPTLTDVPPTFPDTGPSTLPEEQAPHLEALAKRNQTASHILSAAPDDDIEKLVNGLEPVEDEGTELLAQEFTTEDRPEKEVGSPQDRTHIGLKEVQEELEKAFAALDNDK